MAKPVVAIVGRPNVGKSTLFNKLIGSRLSIVDDTPGVTRDRIYGDCEWLNHKFLLVDTGGIEPNTSDVILSQMRTQAEIAISTADVIILVTNIRDGVVASDYDVATMLQKSGKPIVLCVNKCDSIGEPEPEFYEFYNLGLGDPIAISSTHGLGVGDLLDEVTHLFPEDADTSDDEDEIKVAVIGKPNAGKSSLINKILGEDRGIAISDSMRGAGLGEGEFELGGQAVFVKPNGKYAVLEDGTIAASISNLHTEFKNLIEFGIDFKTALKACTINPAKSINEDENIGSIAAGKCADLVFLDEKLDIKEVYINGILA